jgi:methionine sulfoxide reductase catalytic subunit
MAIKRRKPWQISGLAATSEKAYWGRRGLLAAASLAGLAGLGYMASRRDVAQPPPHAAATDTTGDLYPARRNERYVLDRELTDETLVTSYNNYYEFGSSKNIWRQAQELPMRPWEIRIDGLVDAPRVVAIDDLIRRMGLEERLYRFRCVEAWAMALPWTGFALKALIDWASPRSAARYVRFETFLNPDVAPGQRAEWYPWPYVEGLSIAEATHELAFIATGLFGKPLAPQNGGPMRLVVPWKYGFKSGKSLARISFTAERPETFWEAIAPDEYGFWANVNPGFHHPRWSQAREFVLGTDPDKRVPTQLFNGYGDMVAELYRTPEFRGELLYR